MEIPNLESICPVEILWFPPAYMCGFILINMGYDDPYLFPNCCRVEILSILMCPFSSIASSISFRSTQLGVKRIRSLVKPARKPSLTSFMETQSKPAPKLSIYFRILMLVRSEERRVGKEYRSWGETK